MPRAWCRNSEGVGRGRFDVQEDFCWATYRVALREDRQGKEKVDPSIQEATVLSARFIEGQHPDLTAGLGLD